MTTMPACLWQIKHKSPTDLCSEILRFLKHLHFEQIWTKQQITIQIISSTSMKIFRCYVWVFFKYLLLINSVCFIDKLKWIEVDNVFPFPFFFFVFLYRLKWKCVLNSNVLTSSIEMPYSYSVVSWIDRGWIDSNLNGNEKIPAKDSISLSLFAGHHFHELYKGKKYHQQSNRLELILIRILLMRSHFRIKSLTIKIDCTRTIRIDFFDHDVEFLLS